MDSGNRAGLSSIYSHPSGTDHWQSSTRELNGQISVAVSQARLLPSVPCHCVELMCCLI